MPTKTATRPAPHALAWKALAASRSQHIPLPTDTSIDNIMRLLDAAQNISHVWTDPEGAPVAAIWVTADPYYANALKQLAADNHMGRCAAAMIDTLAETMGELEKGSSVMVMHFGGHNRVALLTKNKGYAGIAANYLADLDPTHGGRRCVAAATPAQTGDRA